MSFQFELRPDSWDGPIVVIRDGVIAYRFPRSREGGVTCGELIRRSEVTVQFGSLFVTTCDDDKAAAITPMPSSNSPAMMT